MYLLDVLEEHAEEAAFLWMQRQIAVRSWNYTLNDLRDLEERLLAHVDGLVIGKEAAAEILEPYLTGGEEGEAFAAAFVALQSANSDRMQHVFEVFAKVEGETFDGIRHALRHTESSEAVSRAATYLDADEPQLVAAAIDVLSFRRHDAPFSVGHLLPGRPPEVRAAALEAVGHMAERNFLPHVDDSLTDADPAVQRAALRAGFILGGERVLGACRDLVTQRAANADEAVHLLGLAGVREDQPLIFGAARDETLQPHAVLALGAHGYADIIDPLLELAKDLKDLRGVGCVVSRITGVDIEDDDLESWAEVEASRRGEEPTIEELEAEYTGLEEDPYEGLPPPDLEKLAAWWRANASRFDPHIRLRHGKPLSPELLQEILDHGHMPTRQDAAMELCHKRVAFRLLRVAVFTKTVV